MGKNLIKTCAINSCVIIFNTQHYTKILFFWHLLIENVKIIPIFIISFLILSRDVSLNPWPIQRSPDLNSTIWEPLNRKKLYFLHIKTKSLLSTKDELRCIANKTATTIIEIPKLKLDRNVSDS